MMEETLSNSDVRERILVVDDEPGPRESLRMLLDREFEVICADSVDKGVGLAKERSMDVVIMDIQMPKKDGLEGLKAIRELDPSVSVLMLTAYGTLQSAQQAIRLGATDYLNKPFEIAAIRDTIKRASIRTKCQRKLSQAVNQLQQMAGSASETSRQAEELSTMKTRFRELVHDMRNPLSAIMGYASLLQHELKAEEQQMWTEKEDAMRYLKVIDDGVRRCNELLDLWRQMESSKNVSRKPVSLLEILREVTEFAAPVAAAKGAGIVLEPHPEDVTVMAHRLSLFRAIQNIVTNGVQALYPSVGLIRIRCRRADESVAVEIEDNGCGIPAENVDRIFESRFTTKGTEGGMGLGLSIAKTSIEQHGGSIRVRSEVGKGTTFTVELPVVKTNAAEVA